jgi:hypothetical protein
MYLWKRPCLVFVLLCACEEDPAASSPGSSGSTSSIDTDHESGGEGTTEASTDTPSSSDASYSSSSSEGSSSSSESESGSSSSSSDEGSSSSSTGDDVDLVCEGPAGDAKCETPSPFVAEGDCDPYAQDCPAGEKCTPWANDGGNSWNSTHCWAVAEAPAQLGDACVVEGSGVSGVDDCDVGLMCWAVDPETNMGTCIELCGCGPDAPTCSGGGTVCTISNAGVLPICLPTCDPLDPSVCADGQGCYRSGDTFMCAPDASGTDGSLGDPCAYINTCDPGLFCASADFVPGCFSTSGCCTEFCDLDEANDCTIPGTECVPAFVPGTEPEPCHTDTGVCAAP